MSEKKSPQIVFCHVKDMDDFWLFLSKQSEGYLFRGHEKSSWRLQSGFERSREERMNFLTQKHSLQQHNEWKSKNILIEKGYKIPKLKDEYYALDSYRHYAQIADKSMIEAAAMLQHYGGKTRLLDVTSSILVALFFAFENCNAEERAIWAFAESIFYSQSGIIDNWAVQNTPNEYDPLLCRYELLNNYNLRNAQCLEDANKCFSKEDNTSGAENAKGIIPIRIAGNNSRLTAQNGAFLFPKTLHPFEENLLAALDINDAKLLQDGSQTFNSVAAYQSAYISRPSIIKLIFPKYFYENAQLILQQANISERSIYPDEIGLAKSIRYW